MTHGPPGSPRARSNGCKCDPKLNNYGAGWTDRAGNVRWAPSKGCPLHGSDEPSGRESAAKSAGPDLFQAASGGDPPSRRRPPSSPPPPPGGEGPDDGPDLGPDDVPFNPSSESSRDSADILRGRYGDAKRLAYREIKRAGRHGICIHEIEDILKGTTPTEHQTYSSAVSTMAKKIRVVMLSDRRRKREKTKRFNGVYVADPKWIWNVPLERDEIRARWALNGKGHPDGWPLS